MEASSPLAAMQAPSFMPSWGRNDMYTSHPHSLGGNTVFGPGAFNFRDLSMRRSSNDYFNAKPVRGSSPTASLAADLSQNFHIDMSPQLPTPRRSLFTSNLFGQFEVGRDCVTTPPLPSSSPGPLHEMMDISPLPHKQPYFSTQIEIESPTPGTTPNEEDPVLSSPPGASLLEAPRHTNGVDRRKTVMLRPSLMRTKGYSTNSMPRNPESQLPPFRFGAGASKLSTSTSMTLGECFMESPPQERRPQSANSPSVSIMGPPRSKHSFGSMNGNTRINGSPIGHSRRPSNPMLRPRKQFRRSLSMFESPGDIVQEKKESSPSCLQSVMDIDELHQPVLPHFFEEGQPDCIPRIKKDTLLEVLDGKFDEQFDQRMIIDCRFEYEFEGGHIDGAVNYNDKELLTTQLFQTSLPGKTLLIFHCEYSAHRAPIMARYVRKQDRTTNAECYPKLTYPEVYILDGGYSSFFQQHRERCFPQDYVEMDAKEHAYTCEREMGRLRQNRTKLSRAQTFAFGQGQMDDSPTAPNRSRSNNGGDMLMMGTNTTSPGLSYDRGHARRQVSY
ncbi:rhodanese cycle control phosphatase [Coleophoma cylindrospora]|uniref:M-phase inducer phosphatase n=1 Tax=Coleophoma cylindrospora TaxID=1849047 RepID=A0A3D8SFU7_9HELO|nr:rhodanese cycle control phosphatase [Coleophoma cylindrospora]